MSVDGVLSELPMPAPLDAPPAAAAACIWRTPLARELQRRCLAMVFKAMLVYGQMWQAVDDPPREFDAERSLVAGCMLAVFDAVLRTLPADGEPLVLTQLLREDGGYALCTNVCPNSRGYGDVATTLELVDPSLARARCGLLAYFDGLRRCCGPAT